MYPISENFVGYSVILVLNQHNYLLLDNYVFGKCIQCIHITCMNNENHKENCYNLDKDVTNDKHLALYWGRGL